MKAPMLIGTGLLAVAALTGCSATSAPVTSKGSAPVVSEPSDTSTERSTDPTPDDAADDSTGDSTDDQPTAKVGDTVQIGDWSVRVTKVALNADRTIHAANMFNDRPKRGTHFVLVSFTARYSGSDRKGDFESDLSWSLTQKDQKVLDEASAVTPLDENDAPTTARKGGTVTGQAVFDAASVSLISVDDFENYADFALR